jgi:hypothetical protein
VGSGPARSERRRRRSRYSCCFADTHFSALNEGKSNGSF